MTRAEYIKSVTKLTPIKYCAFCGKKLERKAYPSGTEDLGAFNRRKYCNRECMRKSFLKIGLHEEQNNREAHETAKKIAGLFLDISRCEICGSTKAIDIHHKDGNYNNNNVDNLQVLCRSCHMKIHRPKPICKVDGCSSPVKGYGYCDKHYQRYKKYGNPYVVRWNTKHTKYDNDVIRNLNIKGVKTWNEYIAEVDEDGKFEV